jgi:hypothetical protein
MLFLEEKRRKSEIASLKEKRGKKQYKRPYVKKYLQTNLKFKVAGCFSKHRFEKSIQAKKSLRFLEGSLILYN